MPWIFSLVLAAAALCGLLLLALIVRARGLSIPWRAVWHCSKLYCRALWKGLFTTRESLRPVIRSTRDAFRSLVNRSEELYRVPWLVAIGQAGSGKSALLDALSATHPCNSALQERLSSGTHSNWHFLQSGVVIDLEGAGQGGGWRRCLRQLDEQRPERPVDGIVVTVSAGLLVSGTPAEQRKVADRLFKQLWALQQHLEFSLPVYWVVTQVDEVPGFREFWAALEVSSQQVFGWSSPARLDAQFDAGWVGQAFASLLPRVRELQLRALSKGTFRQEAMGAGDDAAVQPLLLFPRRLEKLQAALTRFASVAFAQTVHQAGVTVRGLYFTGQLGEAQAPALVGELFEKKLFAERNLAAPLRPRLWSRSQGLRRLQKAVLVAAGVLCTAMTASAAHLLWRTNHQSQALRAAAATQPTFHPECPKLSLVRAVFSDAALTEAPTAYWALPASWFDHRSGSLRTQFVSEKLLRRVLFPALRCRLNQQALQLATLPAPGQDVSPLAWLAELSRWEEQRSVFSSLAQPSSARQQPEALSNLNHLVAETLGFEPGPALLPGNAMAMQALQQLAVSPAVVPHLLEQRQAAVRVLDVIARRHRDTLQSTALAGAEACDHLTFASSKLSQALRTVAKWRRGPGALWATAKSESNPCTTLQRALSGAVVELQRRQPQYSKLELSQSVELFGSSQCQAPIESGLRDIRGTACGDLLGLDAGGSRAIPGVPVSKQGVVRASEVALKSLEEGATQRILSLAGLSGAGTTKISQTTLALEQLAGAAFLQGPEPQPFACQSPGNWHPERVTAALAAITGYQRLQHQLGVAGNSLMAGVRERLLQTVSSSLHSAQRRSTGSVGPAATSLQFARVVPKLLQVLAGLSQLGVEPSQIAWGHCLQQFAINGLVDVGRAWGDPFALQATAVPSLTGALPQQARGLYVAFAHKSQGERHFHEGMGQVESLARQAAPYVQWLETASWLGSVPRAIQPLLVRMRETLDAVEAESAGEGTAAATLKAFFTQTLVGITSENCDKRLAIAPDAAGFDEFSSAHRRVHEHALGLCWNQERVTWLWHYRRIRLAFQQRLEGKYPFATLDSPDASPQDIAALARLLAEPGLLKSPPGDLAVQGLGAQEKFLSELRRAVTQLAPYLDGQQGIGVQVTFRPRPLDTKANKDILRWIVRSGEQAAVFPNGGTQLQWRMGEPVSFELLWANRSALRPLVDPEQDDLQVAGQLARFTQGGQWALLRWLQVHHDAAHLDALGTAGVRFVVQLADILTYSVWGPAEVSLELSLKEPNGNRFELEPYPRSAPIEPNSTIGELR